MEPDQVSLPVYKNILETFLQEARFKLPPYKEDPSFDREIIDICLAQDLPADQMEAVARVGVATARWFYPSHDRETQVAIATFTALATAVDDLGDSMVEGLRQYRTRLLARQPLGVKVLQSLFDQVLEMGRFYDTFATDMVFKGAVEFCSANLVEIEKGALLKANKSAPEFVNYFRLKSGIAEPYAFYIFPENLLHGSNPCCHLPLIPDLVGFINAVNDIMSYYKESLIGNERGNAIHLHAAANGQSVVESLSDYQRSALVYLGRVREYASTELVLAEKVEEFIQGFMAFHLMYTRYRLNELCLTVRNYADFI
jgi:hypothetical protein